MRRAKLKWSHVWTNERNKTDIKNLRNWTNELTNVAKVKELRLSQLARSSNPVDLTSSSDN